MSADKLAATIDLRAGEAGPLADLAGGVTWRDGRLNARAELSGWPQAAGFRHAHRVGDDVVIASLVPARRRPATSTSARSSACGPTAGWSSRLSMPD